MKWDTVVSSPAKINIHLDIKERRPDGFHDIISLFHKVNLCDEIRICSLKDADNCSIDGPFDCEPVDNLIIRAAETFLELTGIGEKYLFEVHKRIPAGAGLGGGSGNAASVLAALNRLNGYPLSENDLYAAAERLGSDVPFFLGGSSALVTGRGESLKPLEPLAGYEGVLVVPDIHISTVYAYELFDREGRVCDKLTAGGVEKAYAGGKCGEWPFFNSFWEPMCGEFSLFKEIEAVFKESGCDFFSMSGSGSSIFGLYSDINALSRVFYTFKSRFKRVWKIKLLA